MMYQSDIELSAANPYRRHHPLNTSADHKDDNTRNTRYNSGLRTSLTGVNQSHLTGKALHAEAVTLQAQQENSGMSTAVPQNKPFAQTVLAISQLTNNLSTSIIPQPTHSSLYAHNRHCPVQSDVKLSPDIVVKNEEQDDHWLTYREYHPENSQLRMKKKGNHTDCYFETMRNGNEKIRYKIVQSPSGKHHNPVIYKPKSSTYRTEPRLFLDPIENSYHRDNEFPQNIKLLNINVNKKNKKTVTINGQKHRIVYNWDTKQFEIKARSSMGVRYIPVEMDNSNGKWNFLTSPNVSTLLIDYYTGYKGEGLISQQPLPKNILANINNAGVTQIDGNKYIRIAGDIVQLYPVDNIWAKTRHIDKFKVKNKSVTNIYGLKKNNGMIPLIEKMGEITLAPSARTNKTPPTLDNTLPQYQFKQKHPEKYTEFLTAFQLAQDKFTRAIETANSMNHHERHELLKKVIGMPVHNDQRDHLFTLMNQTQSLLTPIKNGINYVNDPNNPENEVPISKIQFVDFRIKDKNPKSDFDSLINQNINLEVTPQFFNCTPAEQSNLLLKAIIENNSKLIKSYFNPKQLPLADGENCASYPVQHNNDLAQINNNTHLNQTHYEPGRALRDRIQQQNPDILKYLRHNQDSLFDSDKFRHFIKENKNHQYQKEFHDPADMRYMSKNFVTDMFNKKPFTDHEMMSMVLSDASIFVEIINTLAENK